jgi:CRP-like cAMP-binding protein
MPARQRLARYLSRLCRGKACAATGVDAPCTIRLPAKKREIASELAMAPETFSRTVKALEADGIISLSTASVTILDCVRLHGEAEG